MKKQLLLILMLCVLNMQVAIAGVRAAADTAADSKTVANIDPNAKELTAEESTAVGGVVYDAGVKSWSPEDNGSPAVIMRQLDDGYTELTTVEKRTSSGSTPFEEVLSTSKTCMSAKCNPSKASEKDSGDNKKGTGTNGQGSDANDQAVQQIINNANNMANKLANDAANTVVVPPPDPCIANPSLCSPPPVDPCILDPVACIAP